MSLEAAFDAIVEEMSDCGPGIRGFKGVFSHARSAENGNLTVALFAAKMLGAEGLQAFYDKGGRFTDQCDPQGRNVLDIMRQRYNDSLTQQTPQAQDEIKNALDVLDGIIVLQGGLIPTQEKVVHPTASCQPT